VFKLLASAVSPVSVDHTADRTTDRATDRATNTDQSEASHQPVTPKTTTYYLIVSSHDLGAKAETCLTIILKRLCSSRHPGRQRQGP
jgi:hypothetical protein